MNEKLENLLEQPIQVRVAILAGTALLMIGGYYSMMFSPLSEQLSKSNKEIESLELEIAEKRGIAADLPKFEMEVQRLDGELAKALKELPDKKEIDLLLAKISDKARDAGLDIKLFQPMPEQFRDFYAEVPVQISVGGTYHQVATFFDEVGHLERIVNLNEFEMKLPASAQQADQSHQPQGKKRVKGSKQVAPAVQLQTSVVATSFRFLEESERPDAKDKKDGKRRGKKKNKAKKGGNEE